MAIRSFKYITDPKAIEAVADETRRRIIYLLRAKEQTVSQLAETLGKTPQAIYHQIRILTTAGLVEVAREERVGHFIETYFRATAEVFEFRHGEPSKDKKAGKDMMSGLKALPQIGISVDFDKEKIARIEAIAAKISAREVDPELEDRIMTLDDVDFLAKQHAFFLAKYVKMSEKDFDESEADQRELFRLIRSITKPSGKAKKA
ncbi:MAG TPA: winged helix-turn-helix domain-containing protein [Nitrososphaerales archaeon]|nr:winged helix-turn-helix domain-containing protein [Nitrososphaerales archaeon]